MSVRHDVYYFLDLELPLLRKLGVLVISAKEGSYMKEFFLNIIRFLFFEEKQKTSTITLINQGNIVINADKVKVNVNLQHK